MKWRIVALGTSALAALLVFACSDDPAPGAASSSSGPGSPLDGGSVFRAQVEAGSIVESVYGPNGAPTTCRSRPVVDPALLRACLLRTSCSVSPPYRLSDCISQNLVATEDNASCLLAATSCEALNECAIEGFAEAVCKFGDKGGHCYGTKYVDCDARPQTVIDCAKEGKECLLDTPETPDGGTPSTSSTFGCLAPTRSAIDFCQPPESQIKLAQCLADDTFAYCQYGVAQFIECATIGKVCTGQFGFASCKKAALPTCGDAGAESQFTSCSGSVLDECKNGSLEKHDCAAGGLACQSTNGVADCRDPNCTADDVKSCKEQCDGPYANLCVGGARVTVDCRQHGMTRCQAYGSQEPNFGGQDFVRCLPEGVYR